MIGKGTNPFHILGISPNSSFQTVQKAFARLALRYHPDTGTSTTTGNQSKDAANGGDPSVSVADRFVLIRQAYERIRDGSYEYDNDHRRGSSRRTAAPGPIHRNVYSDQVGFSEQDFLQYFYQQTGLKFTSAQRRELLDLHRSRIPCGQYDGPSWDIARRLAAEQEVFLQRKGMHRGDRSESAARGDANNSPIDAANNLRRKRRK